jgi:hypothetical protein
MSVAGLPAAPTLGSPGLGGATVSNSSSIGGMVTFNDPAGNNAYLARASFAAGANIVGLMLFDLLWYNTGITVTTTTGQTINSVAWPARDLAGATSGTGVEIWMWTSATAGNASAVTNSTITYTNQSGAGSKTGTITSYPATPVTGTMVPFNLAGTDTGVQSVQTLTLGTSYVSGTLNLMAIRRIATIPLVTANTAASLDAVGLGLPQLYAGTALYGAVLLSGTAAGSIAGEIQFTYG